MAKFFIAFVLMLFSIRIGFGGNPPDIRSNEIVSIVNINEDIWQSFVYDPQLYELRIDTMPNIKFWTLVMNTSEDWMIINQASNRKVLKVISAKEWNGLSEEDKEIYRNILRDEFCLEQEERIFITRGKSEFYQFRKAMPSIDKGIEAFQNYGVDPWYAQAILLIESPGQLLRSNVGALGSFQLMSKVAVKFGLQVNSKLDERKDFDRSAYAATQLIKTICLPYAREMMASRGLEYNETDLWFRLLVLHIYHAGAYNVKNALASIDPSVQGINLITSLWTTESKGFKNASQNYSQVALASLLQLNDLIHESCVIYHSSEIPVSFVKTYPQGSVYSVLAENQEN